MDEGIYDVYTFKSTIAVELRINSEPLSVCLCIKTESLDY